MSEQALPDLVIIGSPDLMEVQPPVPMEEVPSPAFRERLDILRACMHAYHGIGIAAPQIGWAARVFCLGIEGHAERYPAADAIPFGYWINPTVEPIGSETNWAWEGCLSVPGMRGWVQRPATILARGLDETGTPKEVELSGFAARVYQHEYDHLDGRLYPSRVTEPRWLLPEKSFLQQADWPADWPSPSARASGPGFLATAP
ncbi:MAG: peptide deformylase [Pseudomonadota bacterium]